jgi:hypothetical protein
MTFLHLDRENTETLIELARTVNKMQGILLYEGKQDREDLDALTSKLNIPIPPRFWDHYCEGCDKLQEFARCVVALAHASRTLKEVALLIDADTNSVQQKVDSLIQSLRAHEIQVRDPEPISESIYRSRIPLLNRDLNLLVKVTGEMSLPFTSHEREDYAVRLLILNGNITTENLKGFPKSSDFLTSYNKESFRIIMDSTDNNVRQAYDNIITFLESLFNL